MTRRVYSFWYLLALGFSTPIAWSQQSNELAVISADETIQVASGGTETLIAGSIVAIDAVLDGDKGFRVAAERVHMATDMLRNDELIVGVISPFNVLTPEKAISEFSRRLIVDRTDISALLGRGNAYACIREVTKAIDDFDRAIELQHDNPVLLVRRAETLRRARRYEDAEADCKKAIELAPTMVPAFLTRARVRSDSGQLALAIEDCEAALKVNANSFGAYRCQGCLHILQGDLIAARADFKKGVRLSIKHLGARFDPEDETNMVGGNTALLNKFVAPYADSKTVEGQGQERDWSNWTRVRDSVSSIRERLLLRAICGGYEGRIRFAFDDLTSALRLRISPAMELRLRYCLAVRLLEIKLYTEANECLTDAIRFATDSSNANSPGLGISQLLVERARSWIALGKIQLGIEDCEGVLQLAPSNIPAYLAHGTCLQKVGDFRGAIDDFDQVIRLDKTCLAGYFGRAITKGMQGAWDDVIKDATVILTSENVTPDLLLNTLKLRASAAVELKAFDAAIADLTRLIDIDPEDVDAYRNRGCSWVEKSEFGKALADFDRALRVAPQDVFILNSQGVAFHKKGDYDNAIASFNKAQEVNPKLSVTYGNRARTWLAKGDFGKSISDCDQAIVLDPKSPLPYMNRGATWGAKHEIQKALKDFDQAIKLNPAIADAYRYRGILRLEAGGLAKATDDFNKALALAPEDARICNVVARFRATCSDAGYRDAQVAMDLAKKACKLTQWKVGYYIETLSMAFAENGDFDEAIKNMQRTIDMEPTVLIDRRLSIMGLFRNKMPYRQPEFVVDFKDDDIIP